VFLLQQKTLTDVLQQQKNRVIITKGIHDDGLKQNNLSRLQAGQEVDMGKMAPLKVERMDHLADHNSVFDPI
jgi:hypothetical protein